jgi:hypothetical protein
MVWFNAYGTLPEKVKAELTRRSRSLWDFGEFLHIHAKIPINGAPLGVCKV